MSWVQIHLTSIRFSLNEQCNYRLILIGKVCSKLHWSWSAFLAGNQLTMTGRSSSRTNLIINIPVTLDMLNGWGNFVHLILQANILFQAYKQQVFDLAFKAEISWDPSSFFGNLIQHPGKFFFPNFLTCVNEALELRIDPGCSSEMIIKQLVWEGLNAHISNVVRVVYNEDILQ